MGEDIRRNMVDAPHEVGGFFEGLATAGYEAVPIFLARAIPYGVIESSAFEYLVEQLLVELERAIFWMPSLLLHMERPLRKIILTRTVTGLVKSVKSSAPTCPSSLPWIPMRICLRP